MERSGSSPVGEGEAVERAKSGPRSKRLRRWGPTAALTALILTLGPAGSVVTRWTREMPTVVVKSFGALFLLTAVVFLGWAVWRLRGHLLRSLPWVLGALALVAVQQLTSDRGSAVERAVERMHFLLFGALAAVTFAAARRPVGGGGERASGGLVAAGSALVLVAWVAIVDEILQDALMARAGDLFDVGLNLFAGGIGLVASVGLFPARARGAGRRGLHRLALGAIGLPLALALFLDLAHLGSRIEMEGVGAFRSFYPRPTLERLNRERAERWARRLPPQPPFAWWVLQDDFLVEGGWHVQEMKRALERGDLETVWIENTILERFYSSLLEAPFPEVSHPYRLKPWDLERLRDAGVGEGRTPGDAHALVSDADHGRIWLRPRRSVAWTVAALASAALAFLAWSTRPRAFASQASEEG